MFGNLTLYNLIPHDPIALGGALMVILGAAGTVALITYLGRWRWLAREWLTSLDHKKIGIMYLVLAAVMLARGFADAALMRTQQIFTVMGGDPFLNADHFAQIFTAHGVIMIFFVAMPFMFGLLNLIVPLQIGARDVAFPLLNSISFWLTASAAILINVSLVIGEFAATGWLAYPPLSGLAWSPGSGVDYYIWALQISGLGTLLSGVNFLATIIAMRAPGLTMMRLPLFTWSAFASMALVVFAFPILTVTLALLSLDRIFGTHFFTADLGGNAMMYVNLIWAWGHPEVYILILPSFGIFSEIVATFAQKRLFGYTSMVVAILLITVLSFVVWVHHFFTMGAGANVNAFFGIMTAAIAIPTGVKVFNWLFTMFRGRVIFATPMLWFMGFLTTFTLGGMTGVLLSIPAADFQLHNTLFLVAHFHNMIIGGVLFGFFAGFVYWFPKIFGFKLHEGLGRAAFWFWITGFLMAFVPLYILGFMGATRRLYTVDPETGWQLLLGLAAAGVVVIAIGALLQVVQLVVSIRQRHRLQAGNDPWQGRTLEWATTSPPPHYNFAAVPHVYGRDAFHHMKVRGESLPEPKHDIHMPKDSWLGFGIGVLSFIFGFGLVWHMWWLAGVALVAIAGLVIARSFERETSYTIPLRELA
jgi:cytochrome o ubiquinol oxidase subunit I